MVACLHRAGTVFNRELCYTNNTRSRFSKRGNLVLDPFVGAVCDIRNSVWFHRNESNDTWGSLDYVHRNNEA